RRCPAASGDTAMVRASLMVCLVGMLSLVGVQYFDGRSLARLRGWVRGFGCGDGRLNCDARVRTLGQKECAGQHKCDGSDLRAIQQTMQQGASAFGVAPELSEISGGAGDRKSTRL